MPTGPNAKGARWEPFNTKVGQLRIAVTAPYGGLAERNPPFTDHKGGACRRPRLAWTRVVSPPRKHARGSAVIDEFGEVLESRGHTELVISATDSSRHILGDNRDEGTVGGR